MHARQFRVPSMFEETISRRGTTLVRRLVLEPGEVTSWQVDPLHRVTVIVRGEALAIEYRDGGETERIEVCAGKRTGMHQPIAGTAR